MRLLKFIQIKKMTDTTNYPINFIKSKILKTFYSEFFIFIKETS